MFVQERFTMSVGKVLIRPVKRKLRKFAFNTKCLIDIEEEKGFLINDLFCTISGEEENIDDFFEYLERLNNE